MLVALDSGENRKHAIKKWLIKKIITLLCALPLIASAQVAEGPTYIPTNVIEIPIPIEECSCIKIARNVGVPIPMGTNAADLKPNASPHVGALMLLKYGDVSHVAVIAGYVGDGFVVREGNFKRGVPCVATGRVVPWNDPHIVGFWYPVQ